MTDYTKLIERLRKIAKLEAANAGLDPSDAAEWEAADAIEALQDECADHKENAIRNARQALAFRAERDALQAKLDALQTQEPVAIVSEVHMSRYTIEWTNGLRPEGTKLYAAPKELEPLTDEQQRAIRHQISAMQSAYNVLTDGPIVRVRKYSRELAILDLKRCLDAAHGITKGTP